MALLTEKHHQRTLAPSLQFLIDSLEKERDLSPSNMVDKLKRANVHPSDLEAWADFDHPVADSYGRKMVFKGENFEVMVMSWQPGDFSSIHDHGYTQWGAVQIFGPAEHATFRIEEDQLTTLKRWTVKPGDIVGVSHTLVHQMGNPTEDQPFLSLHIYGTPNGIDNVTGDARLFDVNRGEIQRIDGGVFFALEEKDIKLIENGPKGDFPTRLRNGAETLARLIKMEEEGMPVARRIQEMRSLTYTTREYAPFLEMLEELTDEADQHTHSRYWNQLIHELKVAAGVQENLHGTERTDDDFQRYAEQYDELIGQPCLTGFMAHYLRFFKEQYVPHIQEKRLLSIGCGTGLVEKFMIEELGVQAENLMGIDLSEGMIEEAKKRIAAKCQNVLEMDQDAESWDIAFTGLNVFHYLPPEDLPKAIQKTAEVLKPGAYFIGDFITPDHIRWYPNVVYGKERTLCSLRTPKLVEEDGWMFQESEIVNVQADTELNIHYAGIHRRFLPPLYRIRQYFKDAFGGKVELFDAKSLAPISEHSDSCPSTRYVVVAQKG